MNKPYDQRSRLTATGLATASILTVILVMGIWVAMDSVPAGAKAVVLAAIRLAFARA